MQNIICVYFSHSYFLLTSTGAALVDQKHDRTGIGVFFVVWDVPFKAMCCLLVCHGGSLHVPERLIWVGAWHGRVAVGGELAWTRRP